MADLKFSPASGVLSPRSPSVGLFHHEGSLIDYIPLDSEESFTLETFGSLVESHEAAGKGLVIAQVGTRDKSDLASKLRYYYYSASHINKVLFKQVQETGGASDVVHRYSQHSGPAPLNPLTNSEIVGEVSYFQVLLPSFFQKQRPEPAPQVVSNLAVENIIIDTGESACPPIASTSVPAGDNENLSNPDVSPPLSPPMSPSLSPYPNGPILPRTSSLASPRPNPAVRHAAVETRETQTEFDVESLSPDRPAVPGEQDWSVTGSFFRLFRRGSGVADGTLPRRDSLTSRRSLAESLTSRRSVAEETTGLLQLPHTDAAKLLNLDARAVRTILARTKADTWHGRRLRYVAIYIGTDYHYAYHEPLRVLIREHALDSDPQDVFPSSTTSPQQMNPLQHLIDFIPPTDAAPNAVRRHRQVLHVAFTKAAWFGAFVSLYVAIALLLIGKGILDLTGIRARSDDWVSVLLPFFSFAVDRIIAVMFRVQEHRIVMSAKFMLWAVYILFPVIFFMRSSKQFALSRDLLDIVIPVLLLAWSSSFYVRLSRQKRLI